LAAVNSFCSALAWTSAACKLAVAIFLNPATIAATPNAGNNFLN